MARRYFEIIISGGQLAALIALVALLLAVAFGLGVAVRLFEPQTASTVAAALPSPTPAPAPTAAPVTTAATPVAVPTATPTAATPEPTPTTPAPKPTATRAPVRAKQAPGRWVQATALSKQTEAEGVRNRIMALGFAPKQVVVVPFAGKYRVRVGPFPDGESAGRVMARLQASGFAAAFVVKE